MQQQNAFLFLHLDVCTYFIIKVVIKSIRIMNQFRLDTI